MIECVGVTGGDRKTEVVVTILHHKKNITAK